MMKAAVIALALAAVPAQAEQQNTESDKRAVLAAVDRFFAAVHDKDKAAILAAVAAEGLATAIRLDEAPRMRSWHWPTYAENAIGVPDAWTERLISPEVRIERDIAMVWARYELIAGEKFSHCGVDHFDLVRRNGEWLVYNLTWTNQKKGCPGR